MRCASARRHDQPPFEERANAVMAHSISPASRTSTGLNSTSADGA
jgi:hypothetical protein